MADIIFTSVRPVKVLDQITGPAGEAVTAGRFVRVEGTNGEFLLANASTGSVSKVVGIALTAATQANDAITVMVSGYVDVGNLLSSVGFNSPVYLSANTTNEGLVGSTAENVPQIVGYVRPAWAGMSSTGIGDKLLFVSNVAYATS